MSEVEGEGSECVYGRVGMSKEGKRNELWSVGDGEMLHPDMVWSPGENSLSEMTRAVREDDPLVKLGDKVLTYVGE